MALEDKLDGILYAVFGKDTIVDENNSPQHVNPKYSTPSYGLIGDVEVAWERLEKTRAGLQDGHGQDPQPRETMGSARWSP